MNADRISNGLTAATLEAKWKHNLQWQERSPFKNRMCRSLSWPARAGQEGNDPGGKAHDNRFTRWARGFHLCIHPVRTRHTRRSGNVVRLVVRPTHAPDQHERSHAYRRGHGHRGFLSMAVLRLAQRILRLARVSNGSLLCHGCYQHGRHIHTVLLAAQPQDKPPGLGVKLAGVPMECSGTG